MPWSGQAEYNSLSMVPWLSTKNGKSVVAGKMKEVVKPIGPDGKPTRFSFVTVDGSGHMVSPRHRSSKSLRANIYLHRFLKISQRSHWTC